MNFDEALKIIDDKDYTHVRVIDTGNRRVMDVEKDSGVKTAEELRQYQSHLQSFGRVTFIVANADIVKQKWQNAYHWPVTFAGMASSSVNNSPMVTTSIPGMISANEALLQAQIAELKLKAEWERKLDELKKELEPKKGHQIDQFLKFLPLLPLVIDLKPEKVEQLNSLGALYAAMNGNAPQPQMQGMAGIQELKVQSTPEEEKLIDEIDDGIVALSEKVKLESIRDFIQALNAKPELLQTLTQLAQNFK